MMTLAIKNKNTVRLFLTLTLFLGLFSFSHAEVVCSVEPFTTEIIQGGSASISVITTTDNFDSAVEFSIGNLPTGVTGGFSVADSLQGSGVSKKASIVIQTQGDSQVGSFMIPVLVRRSVGSPSGVEQSICQFNLVIAKSQRTDIPKVSAPTLPRVSSTVASGVLPTEASLFDKKTANTVSSDISQSKTSIFKNTLKRGSQGNEVFMLQVALKILGYFPANVAPTGYYGAVTESAVKAYQSANNINPEGLVGPQTRKLLNR